MFLFSWHVGQQAELLHRLSVCSQVPHQGGLHLSFQTDYKRRLQRWPACGCVRRHRSPLMSERKANKLPLPPPPSPPSGLREPASGAVRLRCGSGRGHGHAEVSQVHHRPRLDHGLWLLGH